MARARMVAVGVAVIIGISHWMVAVAHEGPAPHIRAQPRADEAMILSEEDRARVLRRASFDAPSPTWAAPPLSDSPVCRYVPEEPSGTTAKFTCVQEDGQLLKVKYGRTPEIHAEVAGSELLRLLGFAVDPVTLVRHLRCVGCPRYPFASALVRANAMTRRLLAPPADATTGYTDFEWVSVERRFPARSVESEGAKGWHWWELDDGRPDADAMRLLAVFLAHWDNKAENQRLACLDEDATDDCARPVAMISDLGATFGPAKVNLARWQGLSVWHDRASCTVSMRALPYRGASFPDGVISEEGRARLAARLARIDRETARRLFAGARFPQFQIGTDDRKDLEAWADAFQHRAKQVTGTRCPAASPSRP